jgi:hypothetical protein
MSDSFHDAHSVFFDGSETDPPGSPPQREGDQEDGQPRQGAGVMPAQGYRLHLQAPRLSLRLLYGPPSAANGGGAPAAGKGAAAAASPDRCPCCLLELEGLDAELSAEHQAAAPAPPCQPSAAAVPGGPGQLSVGLSLAVDRLLITERLEPDPLPPNPGRGRAPAAEWSSAYASVLGSGQVGWAVCARAGGNGACHSCRGLP